MGILWVCSCSDKLVERISGRNASNKKIMIIMAAADICCTAAGKSL